MSSSAEGEGPAAQGTPKRFVTEKVSENTLSSKVDGSPSSRQFIQNSGGGAAVTASGPQSPAGKKTVPDGDCTRPLKGKIADRFVLGFSFSFVFFSFFLSKSFHTVKLI